MSNEDVEPRRAVRDEAAAPRENVEKLHQAYELLHLIPPQDRAKDFLLGFIIQHNHTPPSNWKGVIPLASKG